MLEGSWFGLLVFTLRVPPAIQAPTLLRVFLDYWGAFHQTSLRAVRFWLTRALSPCSDPQSTPHVVAFVPCASILAVF